ncbi:MAG: hypothetical protein IT578_12095 [Verrucomicrobiae bacterium]|nr:hypothetical protein [Verrucomicrobiae bacterium]
MTPPHFHAFFRIRIALLIAASLAPSLFPLDAQDAAPSSAASYEDATPPFTNAIPRAVFRDLPDDRDPFSPVGYVKPKPPKPGEAAEAPKPAVDFVNFLVITGISASGEGAVATLSSGESIETGETYLIKDREGNKIAEYKVLSIAEEKVVALFEGREYEFKVRGTDLERFIEKEDPNETKQP